MSRLGNSDPHLHFDVHAGNGPPLLLLHGFLASRALWLANLEALGEVCTPVTAEMWGHGRSPAPQDPSWYRPVSYIDQFEHIRSQLGAPDWFVCGYSLGAGLIMRYAMTHTDRVLGQIVTNSASGFADAEQQVEWRSGARKTSERIAAGGLAAIEKIPVHPRRARRLPTQVYDALMVDAANVDPGGIARTLEFTNAEASVREEVRTNTVPALLCCGRHEKRFQKNRDYAQQYMPNLTIVDLEAGHAVNAEDVEGFNRAVTDFIRLHSPGPA